LIEITAEKVINKVKVTIADSGIGVPEELRAKLFHKFVQGRSTTEKGTGLGLVISKGIVEAHGGSIWFEDNKPKGIKFIFTLPIS
jgi:signal transduction histidine kinase